MDNVAEGLEYQKINFIDMLPNTMAFSPFGKFKRCSWCYNVIKDTGVNFCSEDCKIEDREYYELRRIKRNRELARKIYDTKRKPLGEKRKERKNKKTEADYFATRQAYYKKNKEKIMAKNKIRRELLKQQKVDLLKTMNKI